jgi:UDP-3-O-[3-hydroxymyristoyl] N-acetylglucosamine deacetylase
MARPATVRTTAEPFEVHGSGLHSNRPCAVRVNPSTEGGIVFIHSPSSVAIPAKAEFVGDLSLATTLTKDGVHLQTVEHILAALYGLGIDHATVEVDGDELPILDGSASPWVRAISEAGLRDLPEPKTFIKVLRPIQVQDGNRLVRATQLDSLMLNCTIDFPIPSIGRQSLELDITPNKFRLELAPARTFCLKSEIDYMHSRGLALGGSLDNAVVYDSHCCLNENLRFDNEPVRHKMLDLIGDLALLGTPLLAKINAHAAGHAMHVAFVRKLIAETDAWAMVEAPPSSGRGPTRPLLRPSFAKGLTAV